jgi:hypothetical protein
MARLKTLEIEAQTWFVTNKHKILVDAKSITSGGCKIMFFIQVACCKINNFWWMPSE